MLIYITTLLLMSQGYAQNTPNTPAASAPKKSATQIFEDDPESKAEKSKKFSAKVKVVREESDGVEVFFEGEQQKGAYYLLRSVEGYGGLLKLLEGSRKPQGFAVDITADSERRIKNVSKVEKSQKDPTKDWDFSAVPD